MSKLFRQMDSNQPQTEESLTELIAQERQIIRVFRKAEADRSHAETQLSSWLFELETVYEKALSYLRRVKLSKLLNGKPAKTISAPFSPNSFIQFEQSMASVYQNTENVRHDVNALQSWRTNRFIMQMAAIMLIFVICFILIITFDPLRSLWHYQQAYEAVKTHQWNQAAGEFLIAAELDSTQSLNGRLSRQTMQNTLTFLGVRFDFQSPTDLISANPNLAQAIKSHYSLDWRIGQIKPRFFLSPWVYGIKFTPDSRFLATWDNSDINLWDVESTNLVLIFRHNEKINDLAFSPDSRLFAIASCGKRTEVRRYNKYEQTYYTNNICVKGAVTIVDLTSNVVLKTIIGHDSIVDTVIFHPDSQRLVSTGCVQYDDENYNCIRSEAIIWDISTGNEIDHLSLDIPRVDKGEVSSDGQTLVLGSGSSLVLWPLDSSESSRTLSGNTFALSSNTNMLALTDGTNIKIFSDYQAIDTPFAILQGHTGTVNSVTFHSEPYILVSSSYSDKTVRVWDIGNQTEVHTLTKLDSVGQVVFSPDGRLLAALSNKGVTLWWVSDLP